MNFQELRKSVGLVIVVLFIFGFQDADAEAQYSTEERNALDKFRPMVIDSTTNDYQQADSYLIRWLRARDLNVIAARKMFMESLKWREHYKMDNILDENVILDGLVYPDSMDELDNQGSPVMTYNIGKMDFRRVILEGKKDKLFRLFMQGFEKLEFKTREASNQTGTDITKAVRIGDYQGFNRKQHLCIECVTFSQEYVKAYESNYPGLLKLQVLLNTPRIYNILFRSTVNLQSINTREATKIFTSNRTEWSAFLDKYIAPEKRSYQFGGTKN